MYSAYVLSEKSRNLLLAKYPPIYSKVLCHHITNKFPWDGHLDSYIAKLIVYGYANFSGLEAFVVTRDGIQYRPDGNLYHLTHSLNPSIHKPKDSNYLLKTHKWFIIENIELDVEERVLK